MALNVVADHKTVFNIRMRKRSIDVVMRFAPTCPTVSCCCVYFTHLKKSLIFLKCYHNY